MTGFVPLKNRPAEDEQKPATRVQNTLGSELALD